MYWWRRVHQRDWLTTDWRRRWAHHRIRAVDRRRRQDWKYRPMSHRPFSRVWAGKGITTERRRSRAPWRRGWEHMRWLRYRPWFGVGVHKWVMTERRRRAHRRRWRTRLGKVEARRRSRDRRPLWVMERWRWRTRLSEVRGGRERSKACRRQWIMELRRWRTREGIVGEARRQSRAPRCKWIMERRTGLSEVRVGRERLSRTPWSGAEVWWPGWKRISGGTWESVDGEVWWHSDMPVLWPPLVLKGFCWYWVLEGVLLPRPFIVVIGVSVWYRSFVIFLKEEIKNRMHKWEKVISPKL